MTSRQSLRLLMCLILALSLACSVRQVNGESKTFYPLSDSYISSTEESANFGGKSTFDVSHSYNMFVGTRLGFLMFDLSGVPAGAKISFASLRLYTVTLTETHIIGVHYSADNTWKEYEICWSNCPTFESEPSDTVTVAKNSEWYSWNVTDDATTVLASTDKKLTIAVQSEDVHETGWVWFYSRDQEYSWMDEYRPELVINYTVPQQQTETGIDPSALIVGVIALAFIVALILFYAKQASASDKSKEQTS